MRMAWISLLASGCLWGAVVESRAATLRLSNGDQLTGRIVSESSAAVVLDHELLGMVTLQQAGVTEIVRETPAAAPVLRPPVEWAREVTVGYNLTRGNALDELLAGSLVLNRKTRDDELTLKASGDYASANRRMNAQRYDGMARGRSASVRAWPGTTSTRPRSRMTASPTSSGAPRLPPAWDTGSRIVRRSRSWPRWGSGGSGPSSAARPPAAANSSSPRGYSSSSGSSGMWRCRRT